MQEAKPIQYRKVKQNNNNKFFKKEANFKKIDKFVRHNME